MIIKRLSPNWLGQVHWISLARAWSPLYNLSHHVYVLQSCLFILNFPTEPLIIHTELILAPHQNSPVDVSNRTLYEVTVSPPPLHGPHVITDTTSVTLVTLALDYSTQYNITVSTSLCGNARNASFITGN